MTEFDFYFVIKTHKYLTIAMHGFSQWSQFRDYFLGLHNGGQPCRRQFSLRPRFRLESLEFAHSTPQIFNFLETDIGLGQDQV
jgi:hypothetical protein